MDGKMNLSGIGRIADDTWLAVPNDLQNVGLDEYQIMPNHIHAIVVIRGKHGEHLVDVGDSLRDLTRNGKPVGDLMAKGPYVKDLIRAHFKNPTEDRVRASGSEEKRLTERHRVSTEIHREIFSVALCDSPRKSV
jgi:hypothetical protein